MAAEVPAIALEGAAWTALANPAQGRRRENRAGTVFYCNAGADRAGYRICLHCGRAEPEANATDDAQDAWQHRPLLGKPDADGQCPGAQKPFGVKRRLRLGYEIRTDVFEAQPVGLVTAGAGIALAVAMREALAQRLGIGFDEMGVAAAHRAETLGGRISAFVFDKAVGGSGFSTQAGPLFDDLLGPMESILDCTVAGCVTGCPACVLASDLTEDEATNLDRQGALLVVRSLAANSAPPAEDEAAPGARLTADVLDCIVRARAPEARRLVLRAEAPLDVSSFGSWRAANVAKRWGETGRHVVISVAPRTLAGLDGTALPALRDWLSSWGAVLEEAPDAKLPNGAKVLAEVVGGHGALILATRDPAVFSIDGSWGRPLQAPVVRFASEAELLRGMPVPLDRLQPPPGAKVRTLTTELDGPVRSFGKRMADLLRKTLSDAGAPTEAITGIAYADRYLNSPLTARMAIETLGHLSRGAAGKTVPLRIELRALKPKDKASWRVFDDWAREDDRAEVMGQLASRNGLQLTSKVGAPPHGRSIELAFEGGRKATILLDQGFGAWSTSATPRFAFNESGPRQVKALAESDFRVAAQGSTYVVAHVS